MRLVPYDASKARDQPEPARLASASCQNSPKKSNVRFRRADLESG
jgi:hypothetical protein